MLVSALSLRGLALLLVSTVPRLHPSHFSLASVFFCSDAADLDPSTPFLVVEGQRSNPCLTALLSSATAPLRLSRALLALQRDPPSAFRLFVWAGSHPGFRHTAESRCIAVRNLFCGQMFSQALQILHDLILSIRLTPVFDGLIEILLDTARACRNPEHGVFDAFFGVLMELGFLEEAIGVFLQEKNSPHSAQVAFLQQSAASTNQVEPRSKPKSLETLTLALDRRRKARSNAKRREEANLRRSGVQTVPVLFVVQLDAVVVL